MKSIYLVVGFLAFGLSLAGCDSKTQNEVAVHSSWGDTGERLATKEEAKNALENNTLSLDGAKSESGCYSVADFQNKIGVNYEQGNWEQGGEWSSIKIEDGKFISTGIDMAECLSDTNQPSLYVVGSKRAE